MFLLTPPTLSLEQKDRIAEAESFHELNLLRRELLNPNALQACTTAGELSCFVVIVNMIHDQLIMRSIQLSSQLLEKMGMGKPPVPYAFLQFGSGGRQEQAFVSDQDNGLLYQLPDHLGNHEREEVAQYFQLFVASIVQGLEEAGYPPCHGNVICSNRRWYGSLEGWKRTIDFWHEQPAWENVRYLLLASDARMLVGSGELYSELMSHFHQKIAGNPEIVQRLVSNTSAYHVPVGLFGRLLTEVQGKYRGGINIKNGLYLPYVNCIRLFALASGIQANSTLGRLAGLRQKKIWANGFCEQVESHFRQIIGLRLIPPLHWQGDSYVNNSYVKLTAVSKEMEMTLKNGMRLAVQLQKLSEKLGDKQSEWFG